MTFWRHLDLTRLAALVAFAASIALLENYLQPSEQFCPYGSSCEEVQQSEFSSLLGVPLPVFGVVAFAAVFALSLRPAGKTVLVLRLLALAAGISGVVLLSLQFFVIGQACPYCIVVDSCAILIALVELTSWWQGRPFVRPEGKLLAIWLGGAGLALVTGVLLGSGGGSLPDPVTAQVPPEVAAQWVRGKLNIVEVADFQCPTCRKMHDVLAQFAKEEGDRVHLAHLTAPLPSHVNARDASRAFLCAQAQGKGHEMAEALFTAASLSPQSCEAIARGLGLSMDEFRTCVADPALDQRLDRTLEWATAKSPKGLPITWIQDHILFGVTSLEKVRETARLAETQPPDEQRH
jgi:uncharacterized membrane protein/2-hydroxychromene-2-carboxylate isomerase